MKLDEFLNRIMRAPSEAVADGLLCTITADAMRAKLEKKRADGRGGWWTEECNAADLLESAKEHMGRPNCVEADQLIDAINLIAMARLKLLWEKEAK